jgi:hypothetical protein
MGTGNQGGCALEKLAALIFFNRISLALPFLTGYCKKKPAVFSHKTPLNQEALLVFKIAVKELDGAVHGSGEETRQVVVVVFIGIQLDGFPSLKDLIIEEL